MFQFVLLLRALFASMTYDRQPMSAVTFFWKRRWGLQYASTNG